MISGEPPFYDTDNKELLKSILNTELNFGKDFTSNSQDLISKLLKINPDERLGSGEKGIEEIKSHPFFSDVNWEDIYNKNVRPPFVPMIRSESDTANVDYLFKSDKNIRESTYVGMHSFTTSGYDNYTYIGSETSAIKEESSSPEFDHRGSHKLN